MATVANEFDPNDPNKPQTDGTGVGMPASSGGAGGGGASTAAPAQGGYQPPNVSQYLAANQGAGQQLTQGITGNVQGQANQLSQGVNTARSELEKKAAPLQQNLGEGATSAINDVYKNATSYADPKKLLDDYNAAKAANPTDTTTPNPATLNQFNKLNTGGYGQDITNYGKYGTQQQNILGGQLNNLTDQTGSAANEMGQGQLLRNAVGRNSYNQGEQALDTLFLQGQPGQTSGTSNLRQLQQNLGGIGKAATGQVNTLGTDTQKRLAALHGLSTGNQDYIKSTFGKGLSDITTNVGNELTAAQAGGPAAQAAYAEAAKTGNYTPEQLAALGINPGTHNWGLSSANYLTNNQLGTGAAGNAQVATPEEFARYNALNQLAGGPNGLAANNIFAGQTTAGGYNPVGFRNADYTQAVADQKNKVTNIDLLGAVGQMAGEDTGGLMAKIQAGIAAGTMTPEQANDLVNSQKASTIAKYKNAEDQGGGDVDWSAINAEYNPWANYYGGEYGPAAASVLGQTSPDATPLPPGSNGGIDWTKIGKPTGK